MCSGPSRCQNAVMGDSETNIRVSIDVSAGVITLDGPEKLNANHLPDDRRHQVGGGVKSFLEKRPPKFEPWTGGLL